MGRLIVIEGLDGCGKATQASLLADRLEQTGHSVRRIEFPDYEHDSSALVKLYLSGAFGEQPGDVNAYAASSFYAVDRFASYRQFWKKDYDEGKIIIANRYTTANAPHQMSKLPPEQWDGFLDWLFDYEYSKLGLPEPSLVIQLSLPMEVSQQLLSNRYSGDESKKDIHERAADYLEKCRRCAEYAADRMGWSVVQCAGNGKLMSVEDIGELVWQLVERSGLI